MSDTKTVPTWGYSKKGAQQFDLAPGDDLPKGYYRHPASVPGSEAEKAYRADAEAEGAPTPLITEKAEKPADLPPAAS